MTAHARTVIAAVATLAAGVSPLGAQTSAEFAAAVMPLRQVAAVSVPSSAPAAVAAPARRPFAVGERLDYEVRYGPMRVGRGSIALEAAGEVRGQPAWRAVFRLKGGNAVYSVDNTLESWIDTTSLASLRFSKDVRERGKRRQKSFEIYGERGVYAESGKAEQPTVAQPLDDASFFYFVRTLPLDDGDAYTLDRYFKPDRNPVAIRVLRRERIKVPAGTFDAVVIRPVIKTSGLLGLLVLVLAATGVLLRRKEKEPEENSGTDAAAEA